jgi:hypothetical protein
MHFLFQIIGLVLLLSIAYQDSKDRKVSLYLFVLLAFWGIFSGINKTNFYELLMVTGFNATFLSLQFVILALYFRWVKNKKKLQELIGVGDIVFLFVSCLFFGISNFMFFYIIGISVSLLLAIMLKWTTAASTVPLAGILSVILAFGLILEFYNIYNLRSERLIW